MPKLTDIGIKSLHRCATAKSTNYLQTHRLQLSLTCLIKKSKLRNDVKQRQIKTLNICIVPNHASIKKLIIAIDDFKPTQSP